MKLSPFKAVIPHLIASTLLCLLSIQAKAEADAPQKLAWFIPDGLRADPNTFDIFRWANEGKLPNIKKLMDMGSYGYSIPVFPSHTPANFAALLTGVYPATNGVPDGPMRIEGQSLEKPAVAGFSSTARKVPAIWSEFAKDKRVVLLSMPGSTPPELKGNAITVRGRWGGWGADTHSLIFEKLSIEQRTKQAKNSRLFMQGMELTQYIEPNNTIAWKNDPQNNNYKYLRLEIYGTPIYARIQNKKGHSPKYDSVAFSKDMISVDSTLASGQWSKWIPLNISWKNQSVETNIKLNLIKLSDDGFFRIRVLVNNLNELITEPSVIAKELQKDAGPMVDFPDNFPPQLVYYPEDKATFLEETKQSINWHKNAVDAINKRYKPDILIHDIYTPNQMLTSKWWMGYVDPNSKRYKDIDEKSREKLWGEVMAMYKGIDEIVGKSLKNADKDTLIVFSSDHGAIPLDMSVKLNNLFAKKGWIEYTINPKTGEPAINWQNSKVVFLKMSNVYINPNGLGPTYTRVSGEAYEKLRNEVIEAISSLKDNSGASPLDKVYKWEDVKDTLKLPPDRTGDLVIANKAGYGWAEDITSDGEIFSIPLETGYKQAVFAEKTQGLWAPFIIAGKGIKKNHRIEKPISHVDQLPTILKAMEVNTSRKTEGKLIDEIFIK